MTSPGFTSSQLREQLYADVNEALKDAARRGALTGDRPAAVTALIARALQQHKLAAMANGRAPMEPELETLLARSLFDAFTGLGDLQALIDDPDVENICVNGYDTVWVTYAGNKKVRVGPVASSDDELVVMLQKVAASIGTQERRFDPGMPKLDLRLPGGARLIAVQQVTERPSVSIRRHRFMHVGLPDLVALGAMTPQLAHLLEAMVAARLNMIISGGMGTGKTTVLRALARCIDPSERLITIEDPYELGLDTDPQHPDVVAMQPREPNIEDQGGIDMVALVRWATRMSPDRVFVGEVRGAEVIPLLNAFNQGTDGSFSTIHASTTGEAFQKIAAYARQSEQQLPFDVTAQLIAGGVDIVIQLGRAADGTRIVTGIREVVGADGIQVRSNEIFRPGSDKRAVPANRFSDTMTDRFLDAGFDPADILAGAR
ncbi:MAG TPA: ATPase, T2SS/T4P/T4SS family [Candidatus Limnocylindrales bacterium]|nr:ATPase, T2SS/T4P/T4SS family [Candidatus Limnocylindrales bacterium]